MTMPKEHTSFTQMSIYEDCPKKYKALYWDKESSLDSLSRAYGSVIHATARRTNNLIKRMPNKDDLGVEEIKTFFDSEFKKAGLPYACYDRGWQAVVKHAEETFVRRSEIFKAEFEVTHTLKSGDKSITVLGRIDRIDLVEGGLKIIEYKSGSLLPDREEVSDNLQLNIYAWIVHNTFPEFAPIWKSYWALGLGKEIKVEQDLTKLNELEDYLVNLWERMDSDKEFKATGRGCRYCPIKAKCNRYEEGIKGSLGKVDYEDNSAVVERYKDVKERLKILNDEKETLSDLLKTGINEAVADSLETNAGNVYLVMKQRESKKCLKGYDCPDCQSYVTQWQELKMESKRGKAKKEVKKDV